jgi:hypothetical protein
MEFWSPVSLSTAKTILDEPTIHLEPRRGSGEQVSLFAYAAPYPEPSAITRLDHHSVLAEYIRRTFGGDNIDYGFEPDM